MKKIVPFLFMLCFVLSCNTKQGNYPKDVELLSDTIRYAKGFAIHHYKNYIAVDIRDPWDSTKLLQRYLLISRNKPVPENLPKGTIVRTPIRNLVVYTSVHASIIDQLQETNKIIGVCESRYISTPAIQKALQNGQIVDMGESTSPNIEMMIDRKVEVVIASPFHNSSYGPVENLGIPIIESADYMEPLPLGRTEWIRFYGVLFEKEKMADSIFRAAEKHYMDLKKVVASATTRPTVFAEKKFGQSWYVPAGDSYTANLYKDAGANYIFSYLQGADAVPLTFETVYDKAIHADLWLIKYNLNQDMTYKDLKTEYAPYANFDAFTNHHIFGCNTGIVPYYEEFPLHPDYLLADFIWIFHPELMPDYTPRYYKKLQ